MTFHEPSRDNQRPFTHPGDIPHVRPTKHDIEYDSEAETVAWTERDHVSPSRPQSSAESQYPVGDEATREVHAKEPYLLHQVDVETRW